MNTLRTHWARHAWLAVAGALVLFGCGDDYNFVPDPVPDAGPGDNGEGGMDSGPPEPPPSTPTACTSDDDCAALSNTQLCDAKGGYCVECDPSREAELQRCGSGTFCGPEGHCVLGCQVDTDCLGTTCDTDRGLCINCQSDSNCAPGTICTGAVCTNSCTANEGCPVGWSCCDGVCKNAETDTTSCGTCGKVCNDGDACWNGVCGEPPCAPGTAECDGDPSNGCETPTQDDPKNCGKCHLTCASNFCAGGRCTTVECAPGTADCNGDEDDHCETDLTSVTDCNMCDAKCSDVHGEPSCSKDGCDISCDDGYEDCDDKVSNGCEIDLQTDEKNCGNCDTECTNENGSTKCEDGECVPKCGDGFADCDGDPSNGCETNTDTSLSNCGACGQKCNPDNAAGTCKDGVCRAKCEAGFEDCDGNKANGCEADLGAPETCGSCDNACSANGGKPICNPEDGSCTIKCDVGRADCVNGLADGCETDTTASSSNCGGCGNVCTSTVGTPACEASVCGVSSCTAPLETCPGAGKCQTNLSNDSQNCGDCGHTCAFPSASGKCVNKVCELDQCDSGHKDCNGVPTDGCEVAIGTKDNCRSCGETCTNAHGENECTSSGCSPTCASGWGDCDGNKNNGCETPLTSLTDCGACGQSCTKGHATAKCTSGSCEIAGCNPGWDDCSSNESTAKDGCETQLNTNSNCGQCGVPCAPAHATGSCGTGQCLITACSSGYADCSSGTAGCETQLFTDTNCSACGDACVDTHAANACDPTAHVCKPVCSSGYKSCDGNVSNGCETQTNSATNCGDCGVPCTNPPNATATCSTGACVVTCDSNHLDCTSAAGCETNKGTPTNCRTCGETCTNAHGTAGCNTTTGCTYSCDALFDNCDSNAANGCETSLTTLTNCASCGTACNFPTSSESCSTGSCVATTCNAGTDDCNGLAGDGCEVTLNTVTDCGSCNHACTAQNGTTSCTGSPAACTPVCNPGYKSCDNNPDNGCERSVVTLTDCGNCNTPCSFPNAAATCTLSGSTVSCNQGACSSGYADCTSAAGCETPLGTATNCTACGAACTALHGTNPCSGSPGSYACVPSCDAGWGNCDTNAPNGCETQLNSNTNCGACGQGCSMPHGTATCTSGTCTLTGCTSGFADCNSGSGCETALGTNTDCASCGNACVAANGTNVCTGASGTYDCSPTCNGGFKSCDGNPDNGCERSVTTNTDCGDCNVGCSRANASASCSTGTCTLGTCTTGFGNCDGNAGNGCETTLGTTSNCSACGDVCSNSHGTFACTNRVCVPNCTSGYGDCDGNPSNGCEASLNTAAACGACGNVCSGATPDCIGVTSGGNTTYKCQARVTLMNEVDASTNGPTLDVTHSLSTGTNRIVLAAIVSEANNYTTLAGAKPETVTYGSINMTPVPAPNGLQTSDGSTIVYDPPQLYYYYLTDTGTNKLPASGNQTVHIDSSAGNDDPFMTAVNVIAFTGVDQTNPLLTAPGGRMANPGSTCTTTPTITTILPGTAIYVLSAAQYYQVASSPFIGGITTTMNFDNIGHTIHVYGGYHGGYPTVLPAGANTIGFKYNWCNPAGYLGIGLVPARQP